MKSLLAVLCLVAVASAAPVLEDWRVTGGVKAKLGQFPFAVWLNLGGSVCSGSILNANTVLTAGHCVLRKSPSRFTVYAGFIQRGDRSQSSHKVRSVHINPPYRGGVGGDDVAVLKLQNSIQFDSYRKAINLGSASDVPSIGKQATFAGYGSPTIGTLYWARLTVTKCGYGGPNPVCLTRTPASTQGGDSGGPLFVQRGSEFYQIGVNSGAVGRGSRSYTLQARVDRAASFIRQHM